MAAGCVYFWRNVPNIYPMATIYEDNEDLIDSIDFIDSIHTDHPHIISEQQNWVRSEFHSDVIVKKYLSML
jgi:hypothetical protein